MSCHLKYVEWLCCWCKLTVRKTEETRRNLVSHFCEAYRSPSIGETHCVNARDSISMAYSLIIYTDHWMWLCLYIIARGGQIMFDSRQIGNQNKATRWQGRGSHLTLRRVNVICLCTVGHVTHDE